MSQESQSIIGRDRELVSVDGFLSRIEDGPSALLLDGEAGMGKTVLWKAGLAAASERGYRVLACRPIESETEMAYAALGDLLGVEAAGALPELPGPQRRALEVALLLREPEEEQPAQRAVAVATLGVLAALSHERPLLVAIDDVQWLDPESESVLAFVARRLGHERIGVLVARRAEPQSMSLSISRARCQVTHAGIIRLALPVVQVLAVLERAGMFPEGARLMGRGCCGITASLLPG